MRTTHPASIKITVANALNYIRHLYITNTHTHTHTHISHAITICGCRMCIWSSLYHVYFAHRRFAFTQSFASAAFVSNYLAAIKCAKMPLYHTPPPHAARGRRDRHARVFRCSSAAAFLPSSSSMEAWAWACTCSTLESVQLKHPQHKRYG